MYIEQGFGFVTVLCLRFALVILCLLVSMGWVVGLACFFMLILVGLF